MVSSLLFFCLLFAGCRSLEPNTLPLPADEVAQARAMALFAEAVLLNAEPKPDQPATKERVRRLLEEAYRADPGRLDVAAAYAQSLYDASRFKEALAVYEACLARYPGAADLHRLAFLSAFAAGQSDRLPIHAEALMAAVPDDRKLASYLITALLEAGKDTEALTLIRREQARYHDAEMPRVICSWGASTLAALERDDAGKPADGTLLRRIRALSRTAREMVRAEDLPPSDGLLSGTLLLLEASSYLAESDWRHAFPIIRRQVTADFAIGILTGCSMLGRFLADHPAAAAAFREQEGRTEEDRFFFWTVIGYERMSAESPHEARVALQTAYCVRAGAGETVPESFFQIYGEALERDGCWAESERIVRWGVACHPGSEILKNHLAYLLAMDGRELSVAERLVNEALLARPDSPAYLDTKGWILFKMNRPYEALQFLLQAAESDRDPEICEHIRDVLRTIGRSAEARIAEEASVENPDD
ncbi:MAG: hypothetical protein J6334_02930 [Kiritimatiellae bacterium]|nr:hypothetical protein [Kiritimatiellia bacterium]